jgi:flagellar biosynthesis/type III secretory pathway protein FliH
MADDIDAALDGALGVEGEALAAGYAEGRTRGATSGRDDGWRLGFGRGRELGQELGRIWGRVLMLQASIATQPQRCPDR